MPGPMRNATKPNSRANVGSKPVSRVELPASGCDLPIPTLPKLREWSAQEKRIWRDLWSSPQATQWDDSYISTVAMYVSHASAVMSGQCAAFQAQEARYLSNQLGLSPAGLAALGWVIVDGK